MLSPSRYVRLEGIKTADGNKKMPYYRSQTSLSMHLQIKNHRENRENGKWKMGDSPQSLPIPIPFHASHHLLLSVPSRRQANKQQECVCSRFRVAMIMVSPIFNFVYRPGDAKGINEQRKNRKRQKKIRFVSRRHSSSHSFANPSLSTVPCKSRR